MPQCKAMIKSDKARECQRAASSNGGFCWQHFKMDDKIEECPICLEKLTSLFSVTGHAVIRLHACGHLFHQKCMSIWTATKDSCPLCRATVCFTDTMKLSSNRAAGINAMVSLLPPLIRRTIWYNLEEFVDHFSANHEIEFIPVSP